MGFHLFISICLGVVGTLVSLAFGVDPGWSVLIGGIVFAAYWGVCIIFIDGDMF